MPEFCVYRDASSAEVSRVAKLDPANPFSTVPYARAQAALGATVVVFALVEEGVWVIACCAFMRGRPFLRRVEVPSIPALGEHATEFWEGLFRACRRLRASELSVQSYASPAAQIPRGRTEIERHARCEFVLDLTNWNPQTALATNHRRNIKRARAAGVAISRTQTADAAQTHVGLQRDSMQRRRERGEEVVVSVSTEPYVALLTCGAAELFHAIHGNAVLSSILVLRSETGAYYHSAGTSEEGMVLGASSFLIAETAACLAQEHVRSFNLGGAEPENPGLFRFKVGFGGREVPLEAATFATVPRVVRKATALARVARRDPRAALRAVARLERMVVYAADPRRIAAPHLPTGVTMRALHEDVFRELAATHPPFKPEWARVERLKFNSAFGLFVDGTLAHTAWLIGADHDVLNPVRNVRLRPGEAEITHCFTAPAFRGRGLYPHAIRYLCGIAAELGVRRVFMITNVANAPSRRGIEKAGLTRSGMIYRFIAPWLASRALITVRGHRWMQESR